MTFALTCSQCSKQLLASADGRLPPWCPHCGADFKPESAAESLPPPAAPEPMGPAGLLTTVDAAPTESYFHACVPAFSEKRHRLYRFYVTSSDLLVFALGAGAVSEGQVLPRTRSVMPLRVGLAGAMAALHEAQQLHVARRIEELDTADEPTLRQFAAAGDRAFEIGSEDLAWMTLAGPSLWYGWVCSVGHEAVLKFHHRTRGRWSFALPSLRDARRAVEHLPRLFGDRVRVSLSWGSAGRK